MKKPPRGANKPTGRASRQSGARARSKGKLPMRHVTSINDLSNDEIARIFVLAERYLREFGHPAVKHRISHSTQTASGKILATLFFEPSTRTRLSFESATLRLGGGIITSSDPATSSAAKGESLADTARVVSNYADILVIRHPRDGAAKLAAEFAEIPVINGGDGSHEHPTQTLCDLFTLRKEKGSLKNLNVVISGDLKGSRTIHSFVYALARFGANIMLMPGAIGMELPPHVDWRLRNEFHSHPLPKDETKKKVADNGNFPRARADIDVVYVTADQPHQLSLIPSSEFEVGLRKIKDRVDIFYMTRFQKERWAEEKRNDYLKVDRKFLRESKFKNASVLHPLPRVGELDTELDEMPRAAYFRQAAYGVPVRMALIAALLHLDKDASLTEFAGGFGDPDFPVHTQPKDFGVVCPNKNCITHDDHDGKYAANKFYVVRKEELRLRCFYCEADLESVVIGHKRSRHYGKFSAARKTDPLRQLKDIVFFRDEAAAQKFGYKPYGPPDVATAAE